MEGKPQSTRRSRSRTRKHGHRPGATAQDGQKSLPRKTSNQTNKRPDLGPQYAQVTRTKLPKYSKGYHAIWSMMRDLRQLREKNETTQPNVAKKNVSSRKGVRSRSYSRGRSVYFADSGPLVPYYRSKSVDRGRRENSTYAPVVNEHDVINLTYVGKSARPTSAESRASRARSRRGSGIVQKRIESVPPSRRNSYTFDDLQTRIFQQIQKIYGEPDADVKQKQFFTTLALIQMEHYKMKKLDISKSDRQFLEKTFEEVKSLKSETNKVLKDSDRRYSAQLENASPVDKQFRKMSNRKPVDDTFLQRQRTKGRLRLKPLGGNKNVDIDRIVAHDFYIRRRNTDLRYDTHKQQSRQYFKFEPNRTSIRHGNNNTGNLVRAVKPLTRVHGHPGRPQHQITPRPPPTIETYRNAKQQLMYRTNNRITKYIPRDSPGGNPAYRHRMHGIGK